ncbi:superoxide dismutase [uncultured Demequina sp.]|uniref:superoxide dismutase n=1 Tax=uncultured Demequina sp. TaxID=693499 RepID=UPI0025F8C94B|nr:superoxide dismutase [uncultured Demequina sp.]
MADYTLPDLTYDYGALDPHIAGEIMELHHSKHHAAYVAGANTALEKMAGARDSGDFGAIAGLEKALAFNLGGHTNHSVFWTNMSPDGGDKPTGELAAAIDAAFGSFDKFKEEFANAAATRFGSGWAWLVKKDDGSVAVCSTANQDSPCMGEAVAGCSGKPLLGLDVWEHAYYLNYQNRRPDYIAAFWNVVNWDAVAERFAA